MFRGEVVDKDSTCGTRSKHCWHDSGIMLTSYPGYAVEHCCFCGARHHRALPGKSFGSDHGHGPYAEGGATFSVLPRDPEAK